MMPDDALLKLTNNPGAIRGDGSSSCGNCESMRSQARAAVIVILPPY